MVSLCLVGGLAACVPPTPADPGWTRVSPSYGGRFSNAMISGDGGTVVSTISGTRRIAVDHLATRRHSTFELPPGSYVTSVAHDGSRITFQEFDLDAFVMRTKRLDVATGNIVEVSDRFESFVFSEDLGLAASVTSCSGEPCNVTLSIWTDVTGRVERELPIVLRQVQIQLSPDGSALLLISTTFEGDLATTEIWEVATASGTIRRVDMPLPDDVPAVWPLWWGGAGSELRVQVPIGIDGWEVRTFALREGVAPVEIEPCPGAFSPNGRYCAMVPLDFATGRRALSVADRVTGAVRRLATDSAEPRGPSIDTFATVGDNGQVAFGFHSDLEPDWPVYVAGVTP